MRPDTDLALGGRYRLVSRIAVGGMGEVWVAHDEALARNVAVKVLREEFAGDAGFLERFRTEARNSAQLSHANIAQLYDYGEQDGSGFLVMELVLGEPMSDLLDRQPVLPTRRLLPILAQTARALHAAHVAGVVHRDVKPGNILLARSGRVKITDFGISTASNQIPMTASGMVMGTAQYLSPEQAIGRAATPASDIYSLGIVAYESLVGHRPFTGPTAVDIAIAHVNTPVPPLPGDIDEKLAGLVLRMLDKEPEERPRSAASLARALDDMLDRTPPGGVPNAYGRHARAIDVLDGLHTQDAAAAAGGGNAGGHGGGAGPRQPATQLPRTSPSLLPAPVSVDGPVRRTTSDSPADPGPAPSSPAISPQRPDPARPPGAVPPPSIPASGPAPSAPPATGPTVVPGRSLDHPGPASDGDVPPSYRPTPEPAPHRTGSPTAAPPDAPAPSAARTSVRTSTTTGQRWGWLSRPLVVLVLMVLFALLGAAFADRVWGPSRADSGDGGSANHTEIVTLASTGPELGSGMIWTIPAEHHALRAALPTTTARNL